MDKITIGSSSAQKIFDQLKDAQMNAPQIGMPSSKTEKSEKTFASFLKEGIAEVNQLQKTSDKMSTDIATGDSENIHETMLMATKAGLSFNLMVQVRNKALEAYSEIMRMPV